MAWGRASLVESDWAVVNQENDFGEMDRPPRGKLVEEVIWIGL